ncbi:hypothetical protein Hanom_Chr17g01551061 [Helianthus anomalus]
MPQNIQTAILHQSHSHFNNYSIVYPAMIDITTTSTHSLWLGSKQGLCALSASCAFDNIA